MSAEASPTDHPNDPAMKLRVVCALVSAAIQEYDVCQRADAERIRHLAQRLENLRLSYQEVTTARDELSVAYDDIVSRLTEKNKRIDELEAARRERCTDTATIEIRRLRGWLSYIEGNFRSGPECAAEALRGDDAPEGFRADNGVALIVKGRQQ